MHLGVKKKARKEFLCLLNVKNDDVEFLTCIVKFKHFLKTFINTLFLDYMFYFSNKINILLSD